MVLSEFSDKKKDFSRIFQVETIKDTSRVTQSVKSRKELVRIEDARGSWPTAITHAPRPFISRLALSNRADWFTYRPRQKQIIINLFVYLCDPRWGFSLGLFIHMRAFFYIFIFLPFFVWVRAFSASTLIYGSRERLRYGSRAFIESWSIFRYFSYGIEILYVCTV